MQYVEGYVAFIDILGFSQTASKSENGEDIERLFRFVEYIKDIFNIHKRCQCKIAFFSDSIIITSQENIQNFIIPIGLFERYLLTELGLLYRDGIAKGKYFHKGNIAFGPALIRAHKIETTADESRIVIEDDNMPEGQLEFFRDYDGRCCLNPYRLRIWDAMPKDSSINDVKSFENVNVVEALMTGLQDLRSEIIEGINRTQYMKDENDYKDKTDQEDLERKNNSNIIRKYIWRIIPFNYTCDFLVKHGEGLDYFEKSGSVLTVEDKEKIRKMRLSIEDIVVEYRNI